MSDTLKYNAEALCALVNGGDRRLPLSTTRALDLMAKLHGSKSWNILAQSSDAEWIKARASVLRDLVNSSLVEGKLPIDAGSRIVAQLNQAPVPGTATPKLTEPTQAQPATMDDLLFFLDRKKQDIANILTSQNEEWLKAEFGAAVINWTPPRH